MAAPLGVIGCSQAVTAGGASDSITGTDAAIDADVATDAEAAIDADAAVDAGAPTDGEASARDPVDPTNGAICAVDTGACVGCPQKLDDTTIATMCRFRTRGRVKVGTKQCGGLIAMLAGATDCDRYYLFDPSTKSLVESGGGCNGHIECEWSVTGVPLARSCIHDHAGAWYDSEVGGGDFGLQEVCEIDAATGDER